MQSAQIFSYKGKTPADIAHDELRLALARTGEEQLRFLTELIELSSMFSKSQKPPIMSHLYESVFAFFKKLEEHQVEYLLIDGFAVNAYGFARNTGDLDIWVNDCSGNRAALAKACVALGIAGGELLEKMDWTPGWTGFHLPNGFKVEIMGRLSHFTEMDFKTCFERAEKVHLQNLEIPVLCLDDLLAEKQSTNRPKDKEDITQLLRIKEERR